MANPHIPPRPGTKAPTRVTTLDEITAVIGPDDYIAYDVDPGELSEALALEGAISVTRDLPKYGSSRIFFGTVPGIEQLLLWHLDYAAHIDTVPFKMAQVPLEALPVLKKHAFLGRGVVWQWMWTDRQPPVSPGEDRVVTLDEIADGKVITRFLKHASPHAGVLPGDGRTQRWLGVRNDSGAIVATVAVYLTLGGYSHVTSIAVEESLRGTGLGRALIGYAVRTAVDQTRVCTLGMYDSNDAAMQLADELGFHLTHHWATYHMVAAKS